MSRTKKYTQELKLYVLKCLKKQKAEQRKGSLQIGLSEPYKRTAFLFDIDHQTVKSWEKKAEEILQQTGSKRVSDTYI